MEDLKKIFFEKWLNSFFTRKALEKFEKNLRPYLISYTIIYIFFSLIYLIFILHVPFCKIFLFKTDKVIDILSLLFIFSIVLVGGAYIRKYLYEKEILKKLKSLKREEKNVLRYPITSETTQTIIYQDKTDTAIEALIYKELIERAYGDNFDGSYYSYVIPDFVYEELTKDKEKYPWLKSEFISLSPLELFMRDLEKNATKDIKKEEEMKILEQAKKNKTVLIYEDKDNKEAIKRLLYKGIIEKINEQVVLEIYPYRVNSFIWDKYLEKNEA